jgi:lipoteichoic acid synthase
MKKNLKNCIKSSFFTLAISLIAILWITSLIEITVKLLSGMAVSNVVLAIGYRLLIDLESVLLIAVLLYPMYFLFGYFKKPLAQTAIHIIFSLLVIMQFAMAKYNLSTLLHFSADFFGVSLNDMFINIKASGTPSILYFVPFMFFPIFYNIIENQFAKLRVKK